MPLNEDAIEAEIQAKGLDAPRLSPGMINAKIKSEAYYVFPGTTLTVCALTLENGFIVTGESAAASPANFDQRWARRSLGTTPATRFGLSRGICSARSWREPRHDPDRWPDGPLHPQFAERRRDQPSPRPRACSHGRASHELEQRHGPRRQHREGRRRVPDDHHPHLGQRAGQFGERHRHARRARHLWATSVGVGDGSTAGTWFWPPRA